MEKLKEIFDDKDVSIDVFFPFFFVFFFVFKHDIKQNNLLGNNLPWLSNVSNCDFNFTHTHPVIKLHFSNLETSIRETNFIVDASFFVQQRADLDLNCWFDNHLKATFHLIRSLIL